MNISMLLTKKRLLLKEIRNVQMKVLEYADACRDSGADAEYEEAVDINNKLGSISLKDSA
ncbi:MAG: hypothetical protein HRT38_03965 [Alteromonadaceae bacterium]|nr:hypothetical protein [Alteromonadaceae bacterium]